MSPSEGPSGEALAYDLLRRLYPHLCHVLRYLDEKWWLSDDAAEMRLEIYVLTRHMYRLLKDKEAKNG